MLSTDFHTHILPCIDDGSASVEDSVIMVRSELEQGVKNIVLTPHFNAQTSYPKAFIKGRQNAMESMLAALHDEPVIPNFILGAEVQYCAGMSLWEELGQLSLGDTGYILIELPTNSLDEAIFKELEEIYTERNLVPILAHIERYLSPFRVKKTISIFSNLPVLLQVNCSFFNEKATRKTAIKLLNDGKIHLIGSDCHSSTWRPPCFAQMRDVLSEYANPDAVSSLIANENSILQGEHIIVENHSFY